MSKVNTAIIAGRGIGGLVTALKIHCVGVSVHVCERVQTI